MKELKTISIVFIILGALLLLVGVTYKIMHWPDMFKGAISGPIVLFLGLILFLVYQMKKKDIKNSI
jgi:uncharacterized membrane protein